MKRNFTLFFLALAFCAGAATRYAKPVSSGTGEGSSWANAGSDISALIRASSSGDEVWVSKGTYIGSLDPGSPNPETDNNYFFGLKDGVKVYGGFNGTETLLSQRDFLMNITVFQGGYLTVISLGTGPGTILDGVTITGGNAFDPSSVFTDPISLNGAGLYIANSSMMVRNCIISNNHAEGIGGAVYNLNSSPTFSHCTFLNNNVNAGGGAMANVLSSPVISYCVFAGNVVSATANYIHEMRGGGAIYNENLSSPVIDHCVFYNNHALPNTDDFSMTGSGGVFDNNTSSTPVISNSLFLNNSSAHFGGIIYNQANSKAALMNCTFYENSSADEGAVIYNNDNSGTLLRNAVLWGNTQGGVAGAIVSVDNTKSQVSFSLVEGSGGSGTGWSVSNGIDGGGNLDSNPGFVNTADLDGPDDTLATADDGLILAPCSPAVNNGNNVLIDAADITGGGRLFGPAVDMGAYETGTACDGPLPLSLILFTGEMENGKTIIRWQTSDEINNSYFILQKSTDGIHFITLGKVVSQGNGNHDYSLSDAQPNIGNNFYRLQAAGTDGKTKYSRVVRINSIEHQLETITLYPQPASHFVMLQTSNVSLLNSKAILTDLQGRRIAQIKISQIPMQIDIGVYPAGIYTLTLANGKLMRVIKR